MNPAHVQSVPLFASAPRSKRRHLARLADELDVPAGTVLAAEGELARQFFLIESGTAEVVKDGETVATLGPGDFFGEVGLLAGPVRTASVVAATPMRVLVLAAREFKTMLGDLPKAAERVEQALAERAPAPSRS